jgi:branched-subunit amino acid transport protein
MDFLIGLSSILLLVPFFILVVYLMRMLPREFSLGAIVLMFLGDGVISAMFYYIGLDFIESVKYLKLGITCSFILATIFKVVYMILNQNKFVSILEKQ